MMSEGFHQPGQQQRCCLIDKNKKCLRPAGLTNFTKKLQTAVTATQKKARLQLDEYSRHFLLCDYHKNVVDRLVTKFNKKMMNEETDEEMIIPMSRTSARSPSPLTKVNSTINRGRGNGSQAEYLSGPMPQVDFSVLSAGSVKRCKKYLKIQSRPNLNKNQLAEIVQRHFSSIPVNEQEIIDYFIYTVNSSRKQNYSDDKK